MVFRYIGHYSHIAGMEAKACTQHAAARRLQHGKVYCWVFQYKLCDYRACAITLHHHLVLDIDAIGSGVAHLMPHLLYDVGNKARRRGLTIGTGNGNDGYARRCSRRVQHVDHGLGHIARQTFSWLQVHAEARGSIHFQNGPAIFLYRHRKVWRHDIDAADVQANDAGDTLAQEDIARVHDVGHVCCGTAGVD